MDRIHIDYFEYDNYNLLLMVDSHSKWLEVASIKKCDSDNTIKCLRKWCSCYGLPKQLVSDNGPQFISEMFKYFMKENGINHLRTAAYHQNSNGQAERYVQTVKNGLRSNSTTTSHTDIDSRLDSFLMAYRSTPHTTTGDTPSLRFRGRNINTKLDLMKPDRKSDLVIRKAAQNKYRNAKTRLLLTGDKIVFRSYSGKQNWVQGTVVKRIGSKVYEIDR